jgi:asparagine synthase (glutamine-hydrolysing)
MCGICGFLSLNGEYTVGEEILRGMASTQRHRGPDDEGFHREAGIGLGFSRLAILDLTPAGHQPMSNEDGTMWLVFNGEIYNFQDLVPVLEQAGHRFRSHTDSEVVIHAFEQWGTDCLQRFVGMFAFAIWDSRRRSIFLARDRMGEKPLYYWSDGSHFAFSSEMKALLTLPSIPRDLNLRALQSYLVYEYVPSPASIFAGIHRLPAGHFLKFQLDGSALGRRTTDWRPQQYWDIRFQASEGGRRSLDDYAQELRELLKKAVARCLVSDVPLGVFLSGGLDSSSILALMTEVSNQRPRTFSIGFVEKTFNELDYARLVARHFDTEHHVEILNPDANDLIHTIAGILDEPFADASALPTYLVSSMARQYVTVALSGDAGDELFAGYDWYLAQRFAAATLDRLPTPIRQLLGTSASHMRSTSKKKGMRDIVRRFLEGAALPGGMLHTRWQAFWQDDDLSHLLTIPENERSAALDPRFLSLFAASGSAHTLDQQQYADLKRYLPDDILFKVDRMSMAVSLEARGPLMDYNLVEFAARLPPSLRLHGLSTKYLLKRAMRDVLPTQILHRPKLGFNIPYKNWLRHELLDLLRDVLSPSHLRQQGLFHSGYVQRLIHEHMEGVHDHAHRLWQLLIFQLWAQKYLAGTTTTSQLVHIGESSTRAGRTG